LRKCKARNIEDIPWDEIGWDGYGTKTLKNAFTRMKMDISEYRELSFSGECLQSVGLKRRL
jgi:hypothetical protein